MTAADETAQVERLRPYKMKKRVPPADSDGCVVFTLKKRNKSSHHIGGAALMLL